MSHVAKITLVVRSLSALAAAAKALGCELVRDKKTFEYWGGMKEACDHAIVVPGSKYEVGVVKTSANTFELRADFWRTGGLIEKIGQDANLLKQQYGIALAKQTYGPQGFQFQTITKEDGTVVLSATK